MNKVSIAILLYITGISLGVSQTDNTAKTVYDFNKEGIRSYAKRNFQKADSAFRNCVELAELEEDWKFMGQCLNNLGGVQFQLGNFASGIIEYEKATEIYRKYHLDTLLGESYINLGLAYKRQSIYDSATANFFKGITILEGLGVEGSLMRGYNMTANTLRETNSYDESREWYLKALSIAKNNGDESGLASVYNNLGTLYRKLNKFDSAVMYYRSSLILKEESKNYKRIGNTQFNLGEVFFELSQFDSAESHHLTGLKFRELSKDNFGLAHSYISLAKTFQAQGQIDQVKGYLALAEPLVSNLSSLDLSMKYHETERDYLLTSGDYAAAIRSDQKAKTLKEEILNREKQNLITSYEVRYDVQNLRKTITTQNQRLFWAFIVTVFLALIGVFLFRERQRKKKAAEVIETLFRDMHHRVKNNLTLLNGLITFKRRATQSLETKDILKSIGGQLDTMNLVHQRLYLQRGSEVGKTNLSDYLKELVENVFVSTGLGPEEYNLDFSLSTFQIAAEKANTIGLIVNEVVTNTIKHGKSEDGLWYLAVKIELIDNCIKIELTDKGKGGDTTGISEGKSGLKLIDMLAKQINASLEISGKSGMKLSMVLKE